MSRYDRQERIAGWRQESLAGAKVLIAGAGALGNEVIKNLALVGVGRPRIVDFDTIELSNLCRCVLFTERDLGRSKADVAAAAARRLNPSADIRSLHGDLIHDLGLGIYRRADLVISGLDNIAARAHLGMSCTLADTPFLDGGMWGLGGEVRWFPPGETACFECTLTEADREVAARRRSCTGFRQNGGIEPPAPSTMSTTAIIGGLMAQEAVRFLCGWTVTGGRAIVYNGLKPGLHQSELPRDPDCPYHAPYADIREIDGTAKSLTPADLIRLAEAEMGKGATLEPGRNLLVDFQCPDCGRREPVGEIQGRVDESRLICPACGGTRRPNVLSRLDERSPHVHQTLARLGVPPGEILALHQGEEIRFYELTGDVTSFWSEGER